MMPSLVKHDDVRREMFKGLGSSRPVSAGMRVNGLTIFRTNSSLVWIEVAQELMS